MKDLYAFLDPDNDEEKPGTLDEMSRFVCVCVCVCVFLRRCAWSESGVRCRDVPSAGCCSMR